MDEKEFSKIRLKLGKTQGQMAQLLGISQRSVESLEQGYRRVPVHIERQTLFILSSLKGQYKKMKPCWAVQKCHIERRKNCPAWEFQIGNLCWFINGTVCEGKVQPGWQEKMKICRKCEVFRPVMPDFMSEA